MPIAIESFGTFGVRTLKFIRDLGKLDCAEKWWFAGRLYLPCRHCPERECSIDYWDDGPVSRLTFLFCVLCVFCFIACFYLFLYILLVMTTNCISKNKKMRNKFFKKLLIVFCFSLNDNVCIYVFSFVRSANLQTREIFVQLSKSCLLLLFVSVNVIHKRWCWFCSNQRLFILCAHSSVFGNVNRYMLPLLLII